MRRVFCFRCTSDRRGRRHRQCSFASFPRSHPVLFSPRFGAARFLAGHTGALVNNFDKPRLCHMGVNCCLSPGSCPRSGGLSWPRRRHYTYLEPNRFSGTQREGQEKKKGRIFNIKSLGTRFPAVRTGMNLGKRPLPLITWSLSFLWACYAATVKNLVKITENLSFSASNLWSYYENIQMYMHGAKWSIRYHKLQPKY